MTFSGVDVIVCSKQKPQKIENCQFYDDIGECLRQNPRAAVIANVTSEHRKTVELLIERGIHVLIEKPLSDSCVGVDEILSDAKKRKVITQMGCQLRFHKCIKKIKQLIDEKKIGRVLSARAECGSYLPDWHKYEDYRTSYAGRKELGGGVVLTCIHELDYLYWILGDVAEVFSITGKVSGLDINVDDLSAIVMKFKSGAVGEVHLDFFQKPATRTCKIVGTEGTICWNSDDNSVMYFDHKKNAWEKVLEAKDYPRNQMYLDEVSHFIDSVRSGRATINPIDEGARTLRIALAAMESSEAGSMARA